MPTAYVRYRSGGGYQKVEDYDYVFDARKYLDQGYYRDSGFGPMAVPNESVAVGVDEWTAYGVGIGTTYQGISGTQATTTSAGSITADSYVKQPDEVSHTAPRQLSWYDSTLTFCATSTEAITLTPDHTTDTMTATAHGLGGKRFIISAGTTMPAGLLTNVLYYPVEITANTFKVSLSQNGAAVNFTSNGTGTITATVVDTIAEFPWRDITGWSNTEPTR